jgi:hypothetical protein
MAIFRTLKDAIDSTITRNKKPIDDIAEEMGISYNTLKRYTYEEDITSFAELPLRRLLPLINITGDESILDYLEARRGRIAFKIPKVPTSKEDDTTIIMQYNSTCIEAVTALSKYLAQPSQKNRDRIEEALTEVMKASASCQHLVKKKAFGQLEIAL